MATSRSGAWPKSWSWPGGCKPNLARGQAAREAGVDVGVENPAAPTDLAPMGSMLADSMFTGN